MPPTTVPRWKTAIEQAISKYKAQTVIQIATLDSRSSSSSSSMTTTTARPNDPNTHSATPRVRSHIFREFLSSNSSLASNSLPMLLSSTDVRTPKVGQLDVEPRAEVVWWIEGTQQQFRILADLYVLPAAAPSGSHGAGSDADDEGQGRQRRVHERFIRAVRGAKEGTGIAAFRDSVLDGHGDIEKEWESRRVAMFRTMSAHMKASWCRPTPGRPLEEVGGSEAAKKWPERVVEPDADDEQGLSEEEREERKRNWDMALANFALVVIDPVEVDFVDLSANPDRRWLFTKKKVGEGWVWDEKELVP